MQVTLWAYNREGGELENALQNVIFKHVRLIYKGHADTHNTAYTDSMFITQFVDADLGHYGDDFEGCDTTLQMGYFYNSTSQDPIFMGYNIPPPAFGYSFIHGPLVKSSDPWSVGVKDFYAYKGCENRFMTSFWYKGTGMSISDPNMGVYEGTLQVYNMLNGLTPRGGVPYIDLEGNPTIFPVCGDPVTGTGYIDGIVLPPGYRRLMINSGPFNIALGDTQSVLIAMVGGLGSDRLASITVMKHYTKWARYFADGAFYTGIKEDKLKTPKSFTLFQNYPNPFNPTTTIKFTIPQDDFVTLKIYNTLGKEVASPLSGPVSKGEHKVNWNAEGLPSGVYLYKLTTSQGVETRKMLLLR